RYPLKVQRLPSVWGICNFGPSDRLPRRDLDQNRGGRRWTNRSGDAPRPNVDDLPARIPARARPLLALARGPGVRGRAGNPRVRLSEPTSGTFSGSGSWARPLSRSMPSPLAGLPVLAAISRPLTAPAVTTSQEMNWRVYDERPPVQGKDSPVSGACRRDDADGMRDVPRFGSAL